MALHLLLEAHPLAMETEPLCRLRVVPCAPEWYPEGLLADQRATSLRWTERRKGRAVASPDAEHRRRQLVLISNKVEPLRQDFKYDCVCFSASSGPASKSEMSFTSLALSAAMLRGGQQRCMLGLKWTN